MADIVIAEFMDQAAVDGLAGEYGVLYDAELVDRPEDLTAAVADARALVVRNRTQVTRDLLAAASKLKAVGRLGVGLDNIDQEACRAAGVAVLPATGANDVAVAEYVIAAILTLRRGAYGATAEVAAGDWPRQRLIGREVSGATLGLVGFGGIARKVAVRAAALGMDLIAHDPAIGPDDPVWEEFGVARTGDLDALLDAADAVSLHVPLTDATRGLIGPRALDRMKPGAILVNTARGGVVDEAALVGALKAGRLGGAALDVFAEEPVGPHNPFDGVPSLILTPHIAGVTEESNRRVSAVTAANIRRVLEGA
ncbi:MAG: 3-phosphoglycerate dehydrogenase [Alphaproteobacteria bacterium]|jgi:(S)-sulfolactate dehydrogenase|nr:3-phosphoglycerate dehydrogenase [Alphaproteobacteria bacterium]